jgi:hypothetical protein
MKRKATYRLMVTRREMLYVHDAFDHTLSLVEMEGEPIEYQVGVAGEFVSRRSVTFHDRTGGTGAMKPSSLLLDGAIYSVYEGQRDGRAADQGHLEVYKGTGKLAAQRQCLYRQIGQQPRDHPGHGWDYEM